jgi:hypothetical protein
MMSHEFQTDVLLRLSHVERDQVGMKTIAAEVRDSSKEISEALQSLCILMSKMESSHTTLESSVKRAFDDLADHETRMRVVEGEMQLDDSRCSRDCWAGGNGIAGVDF